MKYHANEYIYIYIHIYIYIYILYIYMCVCIGMYAQYVKRHRNPIKSLRNTLQHHMEHLQQPSTTPYKMRLHLERNCDPKP